jgi:uncharacterized membrane protein
MCHALRSFFIPFVFLPTALAGQVVQGRVMDAATRQPIPAAGVRLIDGDRTIAEVISDSAGRFTLRADARGRYRVAASRIGYTNVMTDGLELLPERALTIEVVMRGEAVKLSPLTLDAPRDRYLVSNGFYERMRSGSGHFMTGDQIRKRNAFALVDLLRGMRGIKIQRLNARNEVYFTGSNCLPMIVLDGVTVRWGGKSVGTLQPLEDLVSISHIEGIEVYRGGSGLPPEFIGPNAACGVILIWTHHR